MRARAALVTALAIAGIVLPGCSTADHLLARPSSLVEMHGSAARSAPALTINWPASVPTYDDDTFVIATAQPDGSVTALWETRSPIRQTADDYEASLSAHGFIREREQVVAAHLVRDYRGPRHWVTVIATRSGEWTALAVKVGSFS